MGYVLFTIYNYGAEELEQVVGADKLEEGGRERLRDSYEMLRYLIIYFFLTRLPLNFALGCDTKSHS
jgi:hypothetical protein